jgi:hypothetical protein
MISPLTILEWIVDLCLEFKKSWCAFLILLLGLSTVLIIHYFFENEKTAWTLSIIVLVAFNWYGWRSEINRKAKEKDLNE